MKEWMDVEDETVRIRKGRNSRMMIVTHNYNKRNLWSKMELKLVGNYMKKIIYASHT